MVKRLKSLGDTRPDVETEPIPLHRPRLKLEFDFLLQSYPGINGICRDRHSAEAPPPPVPIRIVTEVETIEPPAEYSYFVRDLGGVWEIEYTDGRTEKGRRTPRHTY